MGKRLIMSLMEGCHYRFLRDRYSYLYVFDVRFELAISIIVYSVAINSAWTADFFLVPLRSLLKFNGSKKTKKDLFRSRNIRISKLLDISFCVFDNIFLGTL